ncbi:hypothetical protein ASG70_06460 [Phycicoccus sp. Soil748]|nr:hypothetical protein ASG70_06460 [Phycicoccus sp. Soil748]
MEGEAPVVIVKDLVSIPRVYDCGCVNVRAGFAPCARPLKEIVLSLPVLLTETTKVMEASPLALAGT